MARHGHRNQDQLPAEAPPAPHAPEMANPDALNRGYALRSAVSWQQRRLPRMQTLLKGLWRLQSD
ncbi:hypothetical protein DH2020_016863 [Rehmannia glutinosa]|uniref:Uncharacterized protein n=1 Tax=Rehmannia glutinosa TaxID=99300 RepID=A0ABR0WP45_REHGL